MKKNLFMVAAVALMALVSCNKEELGNNTNGVVFVAELEQEASTKTQLGDKGETGRKALWVKGDKISINGTEFSAVSGGEVAEFTTTAEFTEADSYFAIYPSTATGSATAVTIPMEQDGSFANASISVAKSSSKTLNFKNIPAILKFKVPVECSEIVIESSSSISNKVDIHFNDGEEFKVGNGITSGQKKITLKGTFKPNVEYFAAAIPVGTHKLTVRIDGKLSKASTKSVTLERSKIYNLGVLPEPATKLSRNLKFSATEVTGYTSGWVELPTLSGETSGVTYKSSDPSVASVNSQSGELSITEKKGTTIITASAPETDKYLADEVSYTLTVNQSNVRIYVRLWPKINGWDKWKNDPYIYYWGGLSSNSFPGNKLKYEKNNDQYDYYHEFEFSRTKNINFVVTCNQGEQSYDVNNITLDKNYYFSVYTDWHDGGKLTINQDSTTNP